MAEFVNETRVYKALGERLREGRVKRAMTQAQLADVVGLTRTSVTNIEKGRQKISVYMLVKLAAAIGGDAADLLPDDGRSPNPTESAKIPSTVNARTRVAIETIIKKVRKG